MAENKINQETKKGEAIKALNTQMKETALQSTKDRVLEVIKAQRKKYETKVVLALSEVYAMLKEIEDAVK